MLVLALQEEEDHAGARQERQAGPQPDRGDGLRDEQVRGQAHSYHHVSMSVNLFRSGSASGGYSSGLEAAYHNYGKDIFTESLDLYKLLLTGMDMESWRSDKYSNGRYKVRIL